MDHYDEISRAALGWALHHGAGQDAEDVAQDAVLRLWRREQAGAVWVAPAARFDYLHQCVRSVLVDRSRSWAARLAAASAPLTNQASAAAELHALERLELRETLDALGAMGARGACVLLHAQGYEVKEISRALRIKERTVYSNLYAGRAALRPSERGQP